MQRKSKFCLTAGVLSKLPGPNGMRSGSADGTMKTRSPSAVIADIFAPLAVTCWSESDQVENAMTAGFLFGDIGEVGRLTRRSRVTKGDAQ